LFLVGEEEKAIVAYPPTKQAFPLVPWRAFKSPWKGSLHLIEHTRHSLLDGLGQVAKVLSVVVGERINPDHVGLGATAWFSLRRTV
jgi:hypothetical protein